MEDKCINMKNQATDYLKSYFLGCGFKELKDVVINNQNCVMCGTCASLCPRIKMNTIEPELIEYDPECSTCYRYCPRVYFPEDLLKKELFKGNEHDNYSLGSYKEIVAAKTMDDKTSAVSQNGGVVSSLLINALESRLVDGVILTGRDQNWRPVPVIATTPQEILSCAGSKYTIAPTLAIYAEAVSEYKLEKLAFVGMPCQVKAVRKLQLHSP